MQRWGFKTPPRDQIHTFVRLRFFCATDAQLQAIGRHLEDLGRLRNKADYDLARPGRFVDSAAAQQAVKEARKGLAILDAIEADPVQRAAAIAAIQAAFPP